MNRDEVMTAIGQAIDQMVGKTQLSVSRDEEFGVYRRALERGVARLDEFGSDIVNRGASDDRTADFQLRWFISAAVQCAAAAGAILRAMPDGMSIQELSVVESRDPGKRD